MCKEQRQEDWARIANVFHSDVYELTLAPEFYNLYTPMGPTRIQEDGKLSGKCGRSGMHAGRAYWMNQATK